MRAAALLAAPRSLAVAALLTVVAECAEPVSVPQDKSNARIVDSAGGEASASTGGLQVSLASTYITVGDTTRATYILTSSRLRRALRQGDHVVWSSSAPAVARVDSLSGLVTGTGAGTASIVAALAGVISSAPLTVNQTAVASVGVTLASPTILVGGSTTAVATLRDAQGQTLTGRSIIWTSSDPTIAMVDATTGNVLGMAAGTANIIATSEGVSGQAGITVGSPPPPPSAGNCTTITGGIWCDDFEADRFSSYFEVSTANGSLARVAGVGRNGSYGLRAHFAAGQVDAGSLKLAFGRTPSTYFRAVDGGTANYREIYWRVYARTSPGWTGGGDKLTRATIFASSNWAQAMIAHVWGGSGTAANYLIADPASGTDAAGNLLTTTYNDFTHLRWLGAAQTSTPIYDTAHSGIWNCVEAHVKLNTPGSSDGLFEIRINGALEASRTGLNWVGSYTAYGLNAVLLENYWNAGSPVAQDRYFDDFAVSTAPIGCEVTTQTVTASQLATTVQPSDTARSGVVFTRQPAVQLLDASGNPVAQSGVQVTASIASGAGTLGGTAVASTDANGVARFTNLSIGGTVGTRILRFTAGSLAPSASNAVMVLAGPASEVRLSVQPSATASSGIAFAQQPVVQIVDAWGNAVSLSGVAVNAALVGSGATLGGVTSTSTSLSGAASYSNLAISGSGTYALSFSATGLNAVTSQSITVSATSTPVAPILVEDFSTYTSTDNLHADPRNIYAPEEFGGPWGQWKLITLDTTTGVSEAGIGTSRKSMRYTWYDRTNATGIQPDAPRCSDFYIIKQLTIAPVTEVWAEFYVKFSTNWTSKAPSAWNCASNPDYKMIFLVTAPGGRFSLKNDYAGLGSRWDPTAPGEGDGDNNFLYNVFHDNQWHRIRIHSKVAVGGANGAHEVWLDGTKVFSHTGITTTWSGVAQTAINGVMLGANLNQGPDHVMTLNWGLIRVYAANPGW